MRKSAALSGLLLFISLLTSVPVHALVQGHVIDVNQNPIAGAHVTFTEESSPYTSYSALTDEDGFYQIDFAVSVDEDAPQQFSLGQNYPNPFNPSTTIPFSLDTQSRVSLTVFNIMGQKVTTIIDHAMSVGNHTANWNGIDDDGNHVSSGIYFYRLKAGTYIGTGKMLLLDGGGIGSDSVRKPVHKAAKIAAGDTYTVNITHISIMPYDETGVVVTEGITNDFLVSRHTAINSMTFVSIPGGTFLMGDNNGNLNQRPVHTVTISSFEMGCYEITNAQYAEFLNSILTSGVISVKDSTAIGITGNWSGQEFIKMDISDQSSGVYSYCDISYNDNCFSVKTGKENHPVTCVTWFGAKVFAEYYGFDLPTEAEWEYASQGGKQNEYGTNTGSLDTTNANAGSILLSTVVGSYPPNPFGLYDLVGNASEWCADWFGEYPSESVNNPLGMKYGSYRILRGGSYSQGYRSAQRTYIAPSWTHVSSGFRVVRRSPDWQPGEEIYNGPVKDIDDVSFVSIPGGTFEMGDEVGNLHERCRPVHTVTVSDFEMCIYEITNAQYVAYLTEALASGDISATSSGVIGTTGNDTGYEYIDLDYPYMDCEISYNNGEFFVDPGMENRPAGYVTWYGAKAFAFFYGFDLPTEAEWEYACRGGQQFLYGTEDGTLNSLNANSLLNFQLKMNVGSYPANPFGLYDMSGNVMEWCHDFYGEYPSEEVINPTGAKTGSSRITRGGGGLNSNSEEVCLRSAYRSGRFPERGQRDIGFRVARRPNGVIY